MATYQLNVNGQPKQVNVDPSTPLLWVLREELKMTGTKYGCGISACGACTVHVDGVATRSCVVPASLVGDRLIITIEGNSNRTPISRSGSQSSFNIFLPRCVTTTWYFPGSSSTGACHPSA